MQTEPTGTSYLQSKAEIIRSSTYDAHELAARDQAVSEWRDAFRTLGVDFTNTDAMLGAFAAIDVLVFHLVDTEGDVEAFTERLAGGATAIAEWIR